MRWLLLGVGLSCSLGCAANGPGPDVQLADFAVPTAIKEAEKQVVPPAPVSRPTPQTVTGETLKAWAPGKVTPHGDRYDGTYVYVSRTAPKDERVPPPYVVPTAPKVLQRTPPKKPPQAPGRESLPLPRSEAVPPLPGTLAPLGQSPTMPFSPEAPYGLTLP
jgi:hypothetical protein